MKTKAVFLDFFGTVVEDDLMFPVVCEQIRKTSLLNPTSNEILSFWGTTFTGLLEESYGAHFKTLRTIETETLAHVIRKFQSSENPGILCDTLYEYWLHSPIFSDSKTFFKQVPVPVYIISNIDDHDLQMVLTHHQLKVDTIFTSEKAKSYKPRPELFRLALQELSLLPQEVIHVGDSLHSDVQGAKNLGIKPVWLNRKNQGNDLGISADFVCSDLIELFNYGWNQS